MATSEFQRQSNRISGVKIILHILAGIGIMLIADLFTSIIFDIIFTTTPLANIPSWTMVLMRSIGVIVVTYGLLYVYVKKVLHGTMTDFRMGKFNIKLVYVICAIALPLLVIICFIAIGGTLFYRGQNEETIPIMLNALSYAIRAGIVEEMIFRGYIMKLLEVKYNKYVAVLIPSFIFGLLHITSMIEFNVTSLLLLMLAGTSVGVMFSLVTYKNGSIWASAFIHIIWNTIMITNILSIYSGTTFNSEYLFSIALPMDAQIITGGAFGVEASIFAILGYSLVSILTIFIMKNRHHKIKGL